MNKPTSKEIQTRLSISKYLIDKSRRLWRRAIPLVKLFVPSWEDSRKNQWKPTAPSLISPFHGLSDLSWFPCWGLSVITFFLLLEEWDFKGQSAGFWYPTCLCQWRSDRRIRRSSFTHAFWDFCLPSASIAMNVVIQQFHSLASILSSRSRIVT